MLSRSRVTAGIAGVVVALIAAPVAAQSGVAVQTTPHGDPDISGIFTFRTITPLERPEALAGKASLTAEEAAAFEASERTRLNRDLFDPESGAPNAGYQPRAEGGVLSYNEFWYERGIELTADRRTSLIVDPPDGRLPWREESRQARALDRLNLRNGFADHYTDRSLSDRCIMGFNSGPPMSSGAYNNNVLILQIPGYVSSSRTRWCTTPASFRSTDARTARFDSGPATPAGTGRATRWSSRPTTSCGRPPPAGRAGTRNSSNGSGASIRIRCCTSSPSRTTITSPVRGPR